MKPHITDIQEKPGKIRDDFTMNTQAGVKDARPVPRNIIRLAVDRIRIGKRLRAIDHAAVDTLYTDILHHGLMQPIGVQKNPNDTDYTVIWGVHRLKAFQRGWEEAQALLEERGENDPEARAAAVRWQEIPAIVHSHEMPAEYGELKEIAENLIRQSLSPLETDVHRVRYAQLLKKQKLVVAADLKRTGRPPKTEKKSGPHGVGHLPQVTATEKTAKDLGISTEAVRKSHERVTKSAKAVARDMKLAEPKPITAESPVTQETEHTLRLAEKAAQDKVKAEREGKDARKVFTPEPQKPKVITKRIDLSDPAELVAWFAERMNAATKPMSLSFVKRVHAGLGKLIEEASKP